MKILIIGATGSLGEVIRQYFLAHSLDQLTLMARHVDILAGKINPQREQLVPGSVFEPQILTKAIHQQDVVFASLSGDLPAMAQKIIQTMEKAKVKRLIFITSMGIYNEIPPQIGANGNLNHNPILQRYRHAADLIEKSNLDYTIIRPGWFDNGTDLDYQLTKKGEPFGGHDVSRLSIADFGLRLAHDPNFGKRENLGINRKGEK